ncbi:MAG: UDP-N-acetylglucosamine 2-epimerase (non-hydrolyzing) [Nitrospira sp. WS238]|jgi:UDP-N-acetylglucosamine 2-epimerase (non-hydrolysing)|nr:UDP-N-acetylglucosamine 2-epimerase (non-hydrolyzing) [Nitrospira sp. WS238]
MKVLNIVGARPNFMKIAPLMREMRKHPDMDALLVHTGQHYDVKMAGQFFEDLQIPLPDVSLDVGSGTHAVQTAEVMKRLEPIVEQERPDVVVVVGDVNSTMAAALTSVKLHVPVAHVEAGLRSGDRSMPEEINRIVTDAVSDYLFVTEESGRRNLLAEGVPEEKIFFVGNVMIDSLEASRRLWSSSTILNRLKLSSVPYVVATLHRPSNVDDVKVLKGLIDTLLEISRRLPIVFPIHPRTKKALESIGSFGSELYFGPPPTPSHGVHCMDPVGYLDFMSLVAHARLVLTDSGGIQEETTVLGIPCLTLRENTERPITVTHGTNRVIGAMPGRILVEAMKALEGTRSPHPPPPLWDGHASERIVHVLRHQFRARQVA